MYRGVFCLKAISYIFFLVHCMGLEAQEVPFEEILYVSPIGHKVQLSGTFGELRGSHFHSGLDIKSRSGRIGDPVYAVANGWISRIKVEAGGYGQAIYIDHENGTRTVYAHLDKFEPKIATLVRDSQYAYKTFALDLDFQADVLPVKRGDKIAEMGNKGYSSGPHLHFEVRNALNDVAYNPLLFPIPFRLTDSQAPVISGLELSYLDADLAPVHSEALTFRRIGDTYTVDQVVKIPSPQAFTLSVLAEDRQDGTHNKNGLYSLELWRDSSLIQEIRMDSIPFELSHQLKGYINYTQYKASRKKYHSLTRLPGIDLGVYTLPTSLFYLTAEEDKDEHYILVVRDFLGNSSRIKLTVRGTKEPVIHKGPLYNYSLFYDSGNIIKLKNYHLFFPENGLYRNSNLYLLTIKDTSTREISETLQVFNVDIPLKKPLTIHYLLSEEQKSQRKSFFLGRCDENRIVNIGAEVRGDTLIGKSLSLGTFTVMQDTVKPMISSIRVAQNPPAGYRFIFKITDNIHAGRYVKPLRIWAELDGEWHLGEESAKDNRFYVPVPVERLNTLRELKIYAEDSMGNRAEKLVRFNY